MPLQKRPAMEQQPRRFWRGPERGQGTGTGQGCAVPHRPRTASSTRGDRTPAGLSRRRVTGEGQVSSASHQRTGPGEEGGEGGRAGQRQKAAQPLGPASPPRRGRCRRPPQRRPLGRLQPLARPDPAPSPSRDRQPRRRARPLPAEDPHQPPTTLRSPGGGPAPGPGPGPARGRRRSASCCDRRGPSPPRSARPRRFRAPASRESSGGGSSARAPRLSYRES